MLPDDAPAHVAFEKLTTEFGPEQSSANLLLEGASESEVAAYTQAIAQVDGITAVQPVAADGDGHAAARSVGRQLADRGVAGDRRDLRDVEPPPASTPWSAGSPPTPST